MTFLLTVDRRSVIVELVVGDTFWFLWLDGLRIVKAYRGPLDVPVTGILDEAA